MNDWIGLEEGRFLAERAVLVTSDNTLAMAIADPIIEIYNDRRGTRQLKGYATIANHLLVELLDESDEIDLVLDLSGVFKYRLPHPQIRSGKIFSPDAHSTAQFIPTEPWIQIPEKEFEDYLSGLRFCR
jgi:hypothetical protein